MRDLKIGDTAPDIILPRDGGDTITLADFIGQKVIIFFYPRDDTSGCTKEAVGFTQALADFTAANTVVLGISKDSVKKHDKFVAKHDLGIPLLSDEDGDVCERYGTWIEKAMYGKTYMGIVRTTVLIDAQGKIAQIWSNVKVAGHVDAVLDAVRGM